MSDTGKKQKQSNEIFRLSKEKKASPYREPELKKQLLVVSNNYKLLAAIYKMSQEEGAQLRHARPGTPDIFVFSASVKIIDRSYLGSESWKLFCEFLEDLNVCDAEVPEENEDLFDDDIFREETPLIIVDGEKNDGDKYHPVPDHYQGDVLFISQSSVEEIVQAARRMLRESEYFVTSARAVGEQEEKDLANRKKIYGSNP